MSRLLRALGTYALVIGLIAWLWEQPERLLGALVAVAVAYLLVVERSPRIRAFFLVGAALGPVAEVLAILAGAWSYTVTEGLLIPVWLPPAWGLAACLMTGIVDGLAELLGNRPGSGD